MESCVRGFSFMPQSKVQVMELQYVEGGDLERNWKTTRRQRVKEQEQKIWKNFVEGQDACCSVYEEDPYQFLDKLPVDSIRELMEIQLQTLEEDVEKDKDNKAEQPPKEAEDKQMVKIMEPKKDDSDVFHIYYEENDSDSAQEDAESTQHTVREREEYEPSLSVKDDNVSTETSEEDKLTTAEGVRASIANSIYCVKVKELRAAILDEIMNINAIIDSKFYMSFDAQELMKYKKQAVEFCARFNRVHLYQLKRQIADIERNNSTSLPFGKHTQFQAQMVRIVSLHQNILNALQSVQKMSRGDWVPPECGAAVRALLELAAAALSPACCLAAEHQHLYQDEIESTCELLNMTLKNNDMKIEEVLRNASSENIRSAKKSKEKPTLTSRPNGEKDPRLAMYSSNVTTEKRRPLYVPKKKEKPKEVEVVKKSVGSRRPLMRDPDKNHPKRKLKHHRGSDIETMVEKIDTSFSGDQSPSLHNISKNNTRRSNESARQTFRSGKQSKRCTGQTDPLVTLLTEGLTLTDTNEHHNTPRETSGGNTRRERDGESSSSLRRPGSEWNSPRTKSKKDYECGDSVSRVLKKLCTDKSARKEHPARNTKLVCVSSSSPRQPSTPELLRILEETIQKKSPRVDTPISHKLLNKDSLQMVFNIPDEVSSSLFQYRTKYLQYMLSSPMYANGVLGKPWEVISKVAERIINDLLNNCLKEMELEDVVNDMYRLETT